MARGSLLGVPEADPTEPGAARVKRLIGVYNASGTVWGEIAYVMRSRLGSAHCALCDITHGSLREKPEFRELRASYPVPFELVHRDEQDDVLAGVTEGQVPCIAALTEHSLEVLVGADDLAACEGSPSKLMATIERRAAERSLLIR